MSNLIPNRARYALCSALAAALVAGCAGSVDLARGGSGSATEVKSQLPLDRAIASAERAVEKTPQDGAQRIALGNAYLQAGRFESAAAAYEDAIALGDRSARTALSLSLAYVGAGRSGEAASILHQWRDAIPAADLGLGLALAGDTSEGVAILADALRSGPNDPKLRQNLAYAYALDGRWREARLMAAQDVPADRLDARISQWALQGRPEDYQKRVAHLLGTPVRPDEGLPQHLALSATGSTHTAAASGLTNDMDAAVLAISSETELPAVAAVETSAPAPAERSAQPASSVLSPAKDAFAAADFRHDVISRPVVQPISSGPSTRAFASAAPSPGDAVPSDDNAAGTHAVQLGAFSSKANAEHAWKLFVQRNPGLKDRELRISEAMVNGRKFWRVAAAGFDVSSARQMCSRIKGRGGGCIAYAEDRPLPGALPGQDTGQSRFARR